MSNTVLYMFNQNQTRKSNPNTHRRVSTVGLIDGFAAPQAEPLRVSEFQAHPGTHPHVVRAGIASVPQGKARGVLWRRKKVNWSEILN